jgi:hypothetical protein
MTLAVVAPIILPKTSIIVPTLHYTISQTSSHSTKHLAGRARWLSGPLTLSLEIALGRDDRPYRSCQSVGKLFEFGITRSNGL